MCPVCIDAYRYRPTHGQCKRSKCTGLTLRVAMRASSDMSPHAIVQPIMHPTNLFCEPRSCKEPPCILQDNCTSVTVAYKPAHTHCSQTRNPRATQQVTAHQTIALPQQQQALWRSQPPLFGQFQAHPPQTCAPSQTQPPECC